MTLASIDTCIQFGSSLPGAKVYFREDWDCHYFDLAGKYFGLLSPKGDQGPFITLKNKPEINQELRELYPQAIWPGYHTNKSHWNSISLESKDLNEDFLTQQIQASYQLVLASLTKKQQAQVLGDQDV